MTAPRRVVVQTVFLALAGLVAVLFLGIGAGSDAFPPPPQGQAVSVIGPPPGGPAAQAEEGEVTPGEPGAGEVYVDGLRWYEIFFVGVVLIFGICLLLAPLVVLGLIRVPHWRREPASTGARGTLSSEVGTGLTRAVDEALERVEQGQTREAVVACWLLLERAAGAAGSPARSYETTTEYAARLAGEQLVSGPALTRLAGLYRVARFSDHPVEPVMRAQARSALGVLQQELTGGVRW